MKNVLNHKMTKAVSLVLCAILPCAFLAPVFFAAFNHTFVDFLEDNLYNLLWCGLYGCVLVCLAFKSKWIRAFAIMLNLFPFGLLALGSLMGGVFGPLILLAKAIIPFLPL